MIQVVQPRPSKRTLLGRKSVVFQTLLNFRYVVIAWDMSTRRKYHEIVKVFSLKSESSRLENPR